MDTLHIPDVIRDSAPVRARRLDLVSATCRSQGLALATAHEHCAEAFEAADDLFRALRKFQALPTDRKDEMQAWLSETAGRAIDQLGNVQGSIDRKLDQLGLHPTEPLDLSEITAFWESVK